MKKVDFITVVLAVAGMCASAFGIWWAFQAPPIVPFSVEVVLAAGFAFAGFIFTKLLLREI